ncbi:LytR/AlgR family response regulator transcription factor [Pedobacter agri]|uniref:LytR/AlgR family response regulator transcription factor n=1 Tax=Pedobacter agri TaxID=454586 RepID=UPI00292DEC9C|nr:response regulator [Pedobacter agri]
MDYSSNTLFKCVIIDDDQLSIDVLENFINQIPDLHISKTFTDPAQAIIDISENDHIDFLFLDIKMNISGLDVAKLLRDKVRFIFFVTSYDKYALDAFGANGDKFLVKPVVFQKLQTAINEVLHRENKQKGYTVS